MHLSHQAHQEYTGDMALGEDARIYIKSLPCQSIVMGQPPRINPPSLFAFGAFVKQTRLNSHARDPVNLSA